jgi:NADPH:quinone reductase-like Zn-dependent oxidoreductase
VRSYGADNVLDYSDPDVVSKIRVIEPNLQYVFDSIGNKNSSVLAAGGLEGKGKLCTVRPGKMYTEDVKEGVQVSDVMVWTGLGMEVRYGESIWPVNQEDQDLVAELFGMIPGWVEQGVFKGNKARVLEGLGSVEKGFQMFRDGEVSGFKIVYKL